MMRTPQLIKELESLLDSSIDLTMFPYAKGNSIRIGDYIVRSNKKWYHKVFDLSNNTLIAETFCKSSAVALAKGLAKDQHCIKNIIDTDREIMKHYNDCLFFKHTIKVTKDLTRKEVAVVRYDIARERTLRAKKHLDKYIYA